MVARISLENQNNFHQTIYECREFETKDNLSKFVSVINDAYRSVKVMKSESNRISPTEAEKLFEEPNNKIYVCLNPNNEICGTAVLTINQGSAVLGLLSIAPKEQGKGLGLVLMRHVEMEADKLSVNRIKLFVISLFQEKLLQFYISQGYNKSKKILPFPEQYTHLIKKKYLDKTYFVILKKTIKK